jgi:serine/threonine-protein kinase
VAEPQLNPRVFGKYEVIRRLAVGGMGEIFLARQVGMAGFDRLVILKSLLPQLASDPDMLTQFLDEARIVGSINHPNVVACYEVGEWEGVYFIAMEYINGVDIATLQKAADDATMRFPIHVAMAIAREAALGLDSAHNATDANGRALKIVHRDISPHNVMVRHDGLTKVVDFGVAMATNRMKRTEGGLLKGKLGYMAPEQIKGQTLDGRSDQFSLGVMLWELLTGRRLFTAEDPHAVFMKIVRETVPAPSSVMNDVPPELDAIVLKMTAQEPGDRFGRLAEVAAVLRKLLELRGAMEQETQDFVRDLVGVVLAERVRDLTPSPVRILGVRAKEDTGVSAAFCTSCGTQAVKGDRFCRSCGSPIGGGKRTPSSTVAPILPPASSLPSSPPPALDDEFAEIADDAIDVAFDDASGPAEAAVCLGQLELVDMAGAHPAPEAMIRPVAAHLEELASRFGGSVTTTGAKVSASFTGNGRAARNAVAFARRASALAMRAHRDLRLRAAVAAQPGLAHGDNAAQVEADRVLLRANPGSVLVTDRARRLAAAAHATATSVKIPPSASAPEELLAWEVPPPPRIAGRSSERLVVEQAVAAADVGRAQQHLVLGDAGMGKSVLLDLVDAEARDRGFIVARVRCGWLRGPARYDGVRQAIRSASLELMAVNGATGPWTHALDLLNASPHDKKRLVALVDDVVPEVDEDMPLARRRVLLRASILSFFQALAERRGLCLLVDDIHRGDPSSLEVFAEVAARLHTARLVLFAAGRPLHGERVLPFAKRVVLEPLKAKDIAAAASIVAGGALADAVTDRIAKAANGNPLQAALLVKHLVAIHMLRVAGDIVTPSVDLERYPVPPNIAVQLFAAHALMGEPARNVLVAAAHLGAIFDAADVAALLGDAAPDMKEALAECVSTGALVVVDEAAGRYAFPTLSVRELVAGRADPAVAKGWHARFAKHLEGKADAQGRRPLHVEERIALHLAAADDKEGAALASERAAEAWARFGAVEATGEHFRRALQMRWKMLGGNVVEEAAKRALDTAQRATLVLSEIDAAGAVDLAMPIVRLLPADMLRARRADAERARATVLLKLRRTDEAQRALDDTLDALPDDAPADLRGSLLVDVASALEQAGNPDAARTQLVEAIRILRTAPPGTATRVGEALLALGRLQMRARDLLRAREALAQAMEEARRRGSASAQLDAFGVLSALELAEGKPDRALTMLDDGITLAQRVGDGVSEARLRQQVARTQQQLGKVTEALVAARLAYTAAHRVSWDEGTAVASQLVNTLERR